MQEVKSIQSDFITCPHCHAQYHPSEIFMPGSFFGKPDNLVKDALGKILYVDYQEEPDFTEKFECEYCGRPFVIESQATYKTYKEAPELDFSEETVSLLS